MKRIDICIIGGGMVGLSLARSLKDSDLRIAVVESHAPNAEQLLGLHRSERVSAINLASQSYLDSLGVWSQIESKRAQAYSDMQVWDADSFANIEFNAQDMALPNLGYIVENDVIRNALWHEITQQDNLEIIEASISQLHRGESETWLSFDDGQALSCKLVVGADGANSWLRQQMDVPLNFWDYQHTALVATIRTQLPHNNCARQVFTDNGPLAFLPLDDPNLCSIVWSTEASQAQHLIRCSESDFNKQLAIALDMRLGLCEIQSSLSSFPLRMRYARDFAGEGFVLIGDAAHTIHPLAGQGVNLGLMDAAALAQVILKLHKTGDSIDQPQALQHWARWRKSEASQMIAAMEFFKQLFGGNDPVKKLIRGLGMSLVDQSGPLKNQAMRKALGLSGDLPDVCCPKAKQKQS
ncbi:FAD-dependent 2-octaprenylphenol hydroxylase [Alginatibacterium sediminis]|uniref:FAD-dependent 2-octaprenylphenol hydroxylase n=1 Tax=Alginatibacterium sediminis TaxID=2164068 RepID=A0A420EDC4_9ALTE|nr:FAD-dependent monooxygenase [Alginatibacterium sediminis]RKF18673.1 FAD-dependent 2-octaprenylphenol hydroxylase [Alginatibacterium sediminis]